MRDLAHERQRMVERQVAGRGIRDRHVLAAMRAVPREAFVPEALQEVAYEDTPLPIGEGQTISQPYIVGLMAEAAALNPGDRVLEIGAGSGYAAAVMGRIAGRVTAIERRPDLARRAAERMTRLGYDNVEIHTGDGTHGWPAGAPFDAIVVTAAGPRVPRTLTDQLDVGGRLIMPVGESHWEQRLVKVTRTGAARYEAEDLGGVVFVPLVGEHGWTEDPRPLRPADAATRSIAELVRHLLAGAQPRPPGRGD